MNIIDKLNQKKSDLEREYLEIAKKVAKGEDVDDTVLERAMIGLGRSIDDFQGVVRTEQIRLKIVQKQKEYTKAQKRRDELAGVANKLYNEKAATEERHKIELKEAEQKHWAAHVNVLGADREVNVIKEQINKLEDEINGE